MNRPAIVGGVLIELGGDGGAYYGVVAFFRAG